MNSKQLTEVLHLCQRGDAMAGVTCFSTPEALLHTESPSFV